MSRPGGCTCTSIASLVRLDSYERQLLCTRRWRLMDKGIFDFLKSRLDETKEERAKLERNCPLHRYVHPSDLRRGTVDP